MRNVRVEIMHAQNKVMDYLDRVVLKKFQRLVRPIIPQVGSQVRVREGLRFHLQGGSSWVRFPSVRVDMYPMSHEQSNVFAVIGRTRKALQDAGCTAEELDAYICEATTGNYEHALAITRRWVTCVYYEE